MSRRRRWRRSCHRVVLVGLDGAVEVARTKLADHGDDPSDALRLCRSTSNESSPLIWGEISHQVQHVTVS
jgi:hypothetical protein